MFIQVGEISVLPFVTVPGDPNGSIGGLSFPDQRYFDRASALQPQFS